MHPTWRHLRYC